MRLSISHDTTYRYEDQVRNSIQYLRMTPWIMEHQKIENWSIMLPSIGHITSDGFNNTLTTLIRSESHNSLQIQASGIVEIDTSTKSLPLGSTDPMVYLCPTRLTTCSEEMLDFAKQAGAAPNLKAMQQFGAKLLERVPYTSGTTGVKTSAEDAFGKSSGVCQDHAHITIAVARALGVPARYVSGYLYTTDVNHLQSHAWAELWFDGAWYMFDVSNQLYTPQCHVYVAFGRDYNDAAPLRGTRLGGGNETMNSQVWVNRID